MSLYFNLLASSLHLPSTFLSGSHISSETKQAQGMGGERVAIWPPPPVVIPMAGTSPAQPDHCVLGRFITGHGASPGR